MRKKVWAIALFCMVSWHTPQAQPNTLTLLNWNNYIAPQILEAFKAQYGITVKVVAFDSGNKRDGIMVRTKAKNIDLVIGSARSFEDYFQLGLLTAVSQQGLPNLRHLHPKWLSSDHPYRIPYLWGTTGILYRKDKIQITKWEELYRPSPALQGKVQLLPEMRLTVGFALKALGYSMNSHELPKIKEAKALLQQLKPHLYKIAEVYHRANDDIVLGNVWAAISYSGSAHTMQKFHPDITYIVPEEGGQFWIDYIGIVKKRESPLVAFQFVNFLLEPKNSAALTEYTGYANPNPSSDPWLSEKIRNDPLLQVSAQQLEKLEPLEKLSGSMTKYYLDAFSVLNP